MRSHALVQLLALVLLVAWNPQRSLGGDEVVDPARTTYLRYCGACHGDTGKGDGVVSHLLDPKPTDLTNLTKENKGAFPYARIIRVIDGRDSIRAHGAPSMPVWGEIFQVRDGMKLSSQTRVRGKLMLITDYLVSIQGK